MKMKKLSALIALALCLTIGGAYAAWSFVSGEIQDANTASQITMTETTNAGAVGEYEVVNNLVFEVDSDGSLNTTLIGSGTLDITFKPAASAPDTYKNNATPTDITFTVSGITNKYNDKVLLVEDTSANVITVTTSSTYKWTKSGDNFTVSIPASAILAGLDLTSINLPNNDAYNTYAGVLAKYTIDFVISAQ